MSEHRLPRRAMLTSAGDGWKKDPVSNYYGQSFIQAATLTRRGSSSVSGQLPGRQHSTVACRTVNSKPCLEYAAPTNNLRPQGMLLFILVSKHI
ncbi:unnamed protein product [Schistosoma mattheei]|uniref:Uncharacterized protein n=1 Tax=Schistosoma mattheei TaxID=31246 RepID=A0A183PV14_9TREM|nr:unnamed protein product [Schistosoma mattheei]